ncbi:UNVERIFIED_CONTAM: hypothetical protein BEN50_02995 [Euhalothece sp. KZN 001]
MTRLIHDKFAKDYFESFLEPFGQINSQKRVSAEDQYIDVWFEPAPENLEELKELGGLGRMATTPSMFEPVLSASYILGKPQNYALAIVIPLPLSKLAIVFSSYC